MAQKRAKAKPAKAKRARVKRSRPAPRKTKAKRPVRKRRGATLSRRELESIRLGELAVKNKKAARTRKRRRRARERQGLVEARIVEKGKRAVSIYQQLLGALEHMRDASPFNLELEIGAPPEEGKTLWLVVGEFFPTGIIDYDNLGDILATWEDDLILEATIQPSRISWIRWEYAPTDENGEPIPRGKKDDWGFAPSAVGQWSRVIQEARASCDPSIDSPGRESLATRYGRQGFGEGWSAITRIQIYLSARTVSGKDTIEL